MPVTTTSQAGRDAQENATARVARVRAEATARRYAHDLPQIDAAAAEAEPAAARVFPTEELPDGLPDVRSPAPAPSVESRPRKITLQTTVEHRGRAFTIVAEGMTLDQFCDLLDKGGYAPPAGQGTPAAPIATPDDLPEGWKLCQKHGAPMRPRNKQNEHWHSHNVGTKDNPVWCKGYRGADSPGYEL